MIAPARTAAERMHDTLRRLEEDVDAWVATAGDDGPYLVPLSYLWNGETLLFATPAASPTIRNLRACGKARVGIGPTRDLVLIEGSARVLEGSDITSEIGDAFARKTGFDPRELTTPYAYFRLAPRRLQAWREANELPGRDLMRDGDWLTPD